MKKLFVICCIVLMITGLSYAQTIIRLKTGKTFEGEFVEQTDEYIKLEAYGCESTFFMDQIESIQLSDGTIVFPTMSAVVSPVSDVLPPPESDIKDELVTVNPGDESEDYSEKIPEKMTEKITDKEREEFFINSAETGDEDEILYDDGDTNVNKEITIALTKIKKIKNIFRTVFLLIEIYWILAFITILFSCYCLQVVAVKAKVEDAWFAWIPIANLYLMTKIAGWPGWYILFFCIPIVGIIFYVIFWIKIAKIQKKPGWFGLLVMVPIVGIFVLANIAFSK